ncbi:MAG: InlB B-repeat-containing protein [Defluviitaleaceae bacterium]|nr:InlB B-repeat-containing protein [Defluviitaleaceae bacterium]
MKIKRIIIMLIFALLAIAIPMWAVVASDQDIEDEYYIRDRSDIQIVGELQPMLTFAVYGYGEVRATNNTDGEFVSGSQIPEGTQVTFEAIGLNVPGFEFLGWRINGVPYRGQVSPLLSLIVEEDTNVIAVFDHPWANSSTSPPPASYTRVATVNAVGGADGSVNINIPGYSGIVEFEDFSTNTTIEFRISPPEGRYFDENTILSHNQRIEVTLGPILHADGRLAFTIMSPSVNSTDGEVESASAFAVFFDVSGGTMPAGVNTAQSHPYGTVINPLPIPTRAGHTFSGWRRDGNIVTPPLTVNADILLTAVWVSDGGDYTESSQQFAIGFNPAPGSFANAQETGIRVGNAGAVITNMPQNPTRSGYTFGGWRLPGGNTLSGNLTVSGDMILTAIWNVAGSASPSPSPSPNPSPTPAAGQTGTRPNPQTSPLRISFIIFGVVMMAGIAVCSMLKLTRKQLANEGQYRTDVARFNREKRIMDLVDKNIT